MPGDAVLEEASECSLMQDQADREGRESHRTDGGITEYVRRI
jgi:hypothetical protein